MYSVDAGTSFLDPSLMCANPLKISHRLDEPGKECAGYDLD